MGLLAENRQQLILERVRLSGRIEYAGWPKNSALPSYDPPRPCPARKSGLIKKTYGGAVLASPPEMNVSVRYRQTRNLAAKTHHWKIRGRTHQRRRYCLSRAGSTCMRSYRIFRNAKILRITNSLYLMSRLHALRSIALLLPAVNIAPTGWIW